MRSKFRIGGIALLAAASIACTSYFYAIGEIGFPGGAEHFTLWANAIVNGTVAPLFVTQREVGYPLFLVLMGFPRTNNLEPVLIAQAAMAAVMPILVYFQLSRISQTVALITGALAVATLVPVQLMKFIHHDQLHIFLLVLGTALAVRYMQTWRTTYFVGAVLSVIACTFTRPISLLVLPVMLVTIAVTKAAFRPKAGRGVARTVAPFGLAVALFFVAGVANHLHREAVFGLHGAEEPSYTGAQLFYAVYINSDDFDFTITPDIGPATATVYRKLTEMLGPDFEKSPLVIEWLKRPDAVPEFVDKELRGVTSESFIQRYFDKPNAVYFHMLTGHYNRDVELGDVLKGSFFEILTTHPIYVAQFTFRNLRNFLFSPGMGRSMWNTLPVHQQGHVFTLRYHDVGNSAGFLNGEALAQVSAINSSDPKTAAALAEADIYYGSTYTWANQITVYPMLAGFVVCLVGIALWPFKTSREWLLRRVPNFGIVAPTVALPTLVVLYHGFVVSVTAEPLYRYHEMVILLQFAAAAASVALIVQIGVRMLAPIDAEPSHAGIS